MQAGGASSGSASGPERREVSDSLVARVLLVTACVTAAVVVRSLSSEVVLDVDPLNLVYGMARFDLAHHAPHPPGYVTYVLLLRALHVLRGGDPSLAARFQTVQWMALLCHVATVAVVFALVRAARPEQPVRAGLAALCAAFQPFLVFHAVDAQTHTAEALAGALLLFTLVHYAKRPSLGVAVALGLVLAFGASLRPTFVIAGVGPVVLAVYRRPKHLVVAGLWSIAGASAFVVPTLIVSGGYDAFRVANDALVSGVFVRSMSLASSEADAARQGMRLTATLTWLAMLLGPFAVAIVVSGRVGWRAGRRSFGPALASLLPSAAFYVFVFCSEPGYFNGVIPFLIGALALVDDVSAARRGLLVALVLELAVLLIPWRPESGSKMPNVMDLVERERRTRAWLAAFDQAAPAGPVLLVSDLPEVTLSRQVVMHRPDVHVVHFFASPREVFPVTTASFLTREDWVPIPGPAHLVPGPPTVVDVPHGYRVVVVDVVADQRLREAVMARSRCVDSATVVEGFLSIPAPCVRDRIVELDGEGVRFQVTAAPRGIP